MHRLAVHLALAVAMSLVACQDYLFEPVSPSLLAVSNTEFELNTITKADILFVIDDSGSMAGEQQNLIDSFDVFINTIEAENQARLARGDTPLDYQLAVASTSISLRADFGGGIVSRTDYGAGGIGCRTPYTIAINDPYPTGKFMAVGSNQTVLNALVFNDSAELIRQFKENVQLGICGSGQEQGLLAMRRVLEANPTFVRPGSKLVVVFLSDEEDCSDPDDDTVLAVGTDVCVAQANLAGGGTLGPVSDYVNFLRGIADVVSVGVIVSATGVEPNVTAAVCTSATCAASCDCSTGGSQAIIDICNADADKRVNPCYCGGQSPGGRYIQLRNTIAGDSLADSICLDSFADTLKKLAEVALNVDCVGLGSTPFNDDPSLILLKIIPEDGPEILCKSPATAGDICASDPELGWWYDSSGALPQICLCKGNTSSGCQIEPGDKYKVSFVALACSEENPCP